MQLFPWKHEELEIDSETWTNPTIVAGMNICKELATRHSPNQLLISRKLFYQAAGNPTAKEYLEITEVIGRELLETYEADLPAYKAALRGDLWWGSHRRHLSTRAHYAAWIRIGDQAYENIPESLLEKYNDEHLANLTEIRFEGRERIRKWEKGAIILETHPGSLSPNWVKNPARDQSGTLQKALLTIIGEPDSQKKSLSYQANQSKKELSRVGEYASIDLDVKKMSWLWAGLEGEPIPEKTPGIEGIEAYVEAQAVQKIGELFLRGAMQRSWIRQTIRQESYTLQGGLVDSLLKHGETRVLEECPATTEAFKLVMATRIVWDLFCRLETQDVLKTRR